MEGNSAFIDALGMRLKDKDEVYLLEAFDHLRAVPPLGTYLDVPSSDLFDLGKLIWT